MDHRTQPEKSKQQQVIEAQNRGCFAVLAGVLVGLVVFLASLPFFTWWFEHGFRADEIPFNKIGVFICASIFFPLCIGLGAFLGFKVRHRLPWR